MITRIETVRNVPSGSSRSSQSTESESIRVAVLQRVCTSYRYELFRRLSRSSNLDVRVFIGDDIPGTKVRNTAVFEGLDVKRLGTSYLRWGQRILPIHHGLTNGLRAFRPDVILCEGESHFLGCLSALRYRNRHPQTALVHWSLGRLPGVSIQRNKLRTFVKYSVQKRFDVLVSYSSFGRSGLIALGHAPEKIMVVPNVSCTNAHLEASRTLSVSRAEARAHLGLGERFTVLYSGAMNANKRPEMLLDLARISDPELYNFVLLGDGDMLEGLRARAKREDLQNVFLPGRVSEELRYYYRAADVMLLPGRGGMVISEAMAWSLPVIVHKADGTEYDLVRNCETGLRVQGGTAADFRSGLEFLRIHRNIAEEWGAAGQGLLIERFSLNRAVHELTRAVRTARNLRIK